MATEKSAAVLTIKDAGKMTPSGARAVANWLRKQAGYLERANERKALSDRYRARYLYSEES
jgi:hypothetical protein